MKAKLTVYSTLAEIEAISFLYFPQNSWMFLQFPVGSLYSTVCLSANRDQGTRSIAVHYPPEGNQKRPGNISG